MATLITRELGLTPKLSELLVEDTDNNFINLKEEVDALEQVVLTLEIFFSDDANG